MIDNSLEEWRPVKEYEGHYEVSSLGRVRSLKYGKIRILKPHLNNCGRIDVCLHKNGEQRVILVHRIVAFAFPEICGEYFTGADVNHKDENPQNNKAINIEWCDRRYNINYGTRNERVAKKRRKPCGQYRNGVLLRSFTSVKEAEEETGIQRTSIRSCCNKKKYFKTAGGYEWRYI